MQTEQSSSINWNAFLDTAANAYVATHTPAPASPTVGTVPLTGTNYAEGQAVAGGVLSSPLVIGLGVAAALAVGWLLIKKSE